MEQTGVGPAVWCGVSRRCPGPQPKDQPRDQPPVLQNKGKVLFSPMEEKTKGKANAFSFLKQEDVQKTETLMVLIFRLGQKSKRDLNREEVHEMPEKEVESSELWKQLTMSEFPGSSMDEWAEMGSVAEGFFKNSSRTS